jgi:hypothetical protein
MSHFGIPGIGGSLGECALCGHTFMKEIITGSRVKSITLPGCDATLYAHDKCIEKYQGKDWHELPPESSLRRAYERSEKESPSDIESDG